MTFPTNPKIKVKLIGRDGNALVIIEACKRAAIDANVSDDDIRLFTAEAVSDDYNHLLATVAKYYEVI